MPFYVYKHKAKKIKLKITAPHIANLCMVFYMYLNGDFYLHRVNPMINKTEPGTSLNAIKTTHNTC